MKETKHSASRKPSENLQKMLWISHVNITHYCKGKITQLTSVGIRGYPVMSNSCGGKQTTASVERQNSTVHLHQSFSTIDQSIRDFFFFPKKKKIENINLFRKHWILDIQAGINQMICNWQNPKSYKKKWEREASIRCRFMHNQPTWDWEGVVKRGKLTTVKGERGHSVVCLSIGVHKNSPPTQRDVGEDGPTNCGCRHRIYASKQDEWELLEEIGK